MNDYEKNNESQEEEILNQKLLEFQNKVSCGINKTMSSTAECLDKTAEKFHKTAAFFRKKNADSIKSEVSEITKKYPAHIMVGAIIIGFLVGKVISK